MNAFGCGFRENGGGGDLFLEMPDKAPRRITLQEPYETYLPDSVIQHIHNRHQAEGEIAIAGNPKSRIRKAINIIEAKQSDSTDIIADMKSESG